MQLILNMGETLQWLGRHDAANTTFALAVARGVLAHPQQRPSHLVRGLFAAPWWDLLPATSPALKKLLRPASMRILQEEGRRLLRSAGLDGALAALILVCRPVSRQQHTERVGQAIPAAARLHGQWRCRLRARRRCPVARRENNH